MANLQRPDLLIKSTTQRSGRGAANERAVLTALFLVAFLMRVAYRLYLGQADYWENGYTFFLEMARNIVAGHGLRINKAWAVRPPAYPVFLAAGMIFGGNYLFVVIPQALWGAGSAICAFLIGKELFDSRTGFIAAALTAFYPYFVVHDTALQETSMMTFATVLAVYLLLRARSGNSMLLWIGAGLILGLDVMIRTTMLPFAMVAPLWIILFGEGTLTHKLFRAGCVVLMVGLILGSWLVRNYVHLGHAVISSEVGQQFWRAHNSMTFSHYPSESMDLSADNAYEAFTAADRTKAESLSGDELALDAFFWNKGISFVWDHPLGAFVEAFLKIGAGFSWIINPRHGPLVQAIYFFSYVPIFVFGAVGMVLSRRAWKLHSIIYTLFLSFILVTAIFWAHTNHRTHLDVYFMIFAGYTLVRLEPWMAASWRSTQ